MQKQYRTFDLSAPQPPQAPSTQNIDSTDLASLGIIGAAVALFIAQKDSSKDVSLSPYLLLGALLLLFQA